MTTINNPVGRHRRRPRWAAVLITTGAVLAVGAAVTLLLLVAVSRANAQSGGSGGHAGGTYVGQVVPGAACVGHEGDRGTKNGRPYVCVQQYGEDCAHWHRVIVRGEPTGYWSPRPPAPCPSCSPSSSPSAAPSSPRPSSPKPSSAPPSPSTSVSTTLSSPPATPPDNPGGPSLPVTGPGVALTVAAGLVLCGLGWLMRRASRRRG